MHWLELALPNPQDRRIHQKEKGNNSGSTHNFIHYKLAKALNCFVYPTPEFQVMIVDGGTSNCSGKCNMINLTMGEYVMNSPMIVIPMGGVDVVLVIQWLQSLGTIGF
jgi:hypothetical protein